MNVVRMKPPLESRHDGKLTPGAYGWNGAELPNGNDPQQPRQWEAGTNTFACCPQATCDRICTGCGRLFCARCAPAAGITAGRGAPCPTCKASAVYLRGKEPTGNTPHPSHRGF